MRRAALGLIVVVACLVALVIVAHAPFVRAAALRYALGRVERDYGFRITASRLDYNLATLTAGLENVSVTARAPAREPFFAADYVSVTIARSALFGDVAFDNLAVSNGRVTIRRYADGTTNLPRGSEGPSTEPPPLRLARVDIPRIALDIRDESARLAAFVPEVALLLKSDEGFIRLSRPATITVGDHETTITRLDGQATFDGRTLHVSELQADAPEASLRASGALTLIASEPSADLQLTATGNVERVARWAIAEGELPRGSAAVEARISGPLATPQAELRVTSTALSWQRIMLNNLSAALSVNADTAEVTDARFDINGARVTATASVPFASDTPANLRAMWSGLDVAATTRMLAPGAAASPAATASGTLEWQGTLSAPDRGRATIDLRLAPGRNTARRLAVGGDVRATLRDGLWSVDGRTLIGGVAPMTIAGRGRLPAVGSDALTIDEGTVRVASTALPALIAVLQNTALVELSDVHVTDGAATADITLRGAMTDPDVMATASVDHLAAGQIDVASAQISVSGRLREPELQFILTAPAATVAGQHLDNVRSTGRLAGSLLRLDELAVAQPDGSGTLLATGTYNLDTEEFAVSAYGSNWEIAQTDDIPFSGMAALRLMGTGTVMNPHLQGQVAVKGVRTPSIDVGDVTADLLVDQRLTSISARAPDLSAIATAQIHLDEPYPSVIDVRATDLDVLRVLGNVQTTIPLRATTTVALHGEGPLQNVRDSSATIDVSALEGAAGDLPIRLVDPARLRYSADRVYVDRLEAAAGETRLSVSGELPVSNAPNLTRFGPRTGLAPQAGLGPQGERSQRDTGLIATITGDVGEVVRAAAAAGITDLPVAGGSGPVAVLARVTGSVEEPDVAADVEVGPGDIALKDLPEVSRVRLRAHAGEGWLELRESGLSYQGAEIVATGKVPIDWVAGNDLFRPKAEATTSELHARATNVTPAVLSPFLDQATVDELSGSVDVTLDATSTSPKIEDVAGELRIDRLDVRVSELPITQRTPTRIVARDGYARIEAWDWTGQGATLGVRGQVRLSDLQSAILANGVVDMRVLTPFVRDAGMATAGRLEPRLSITGPLDDPRIDGDLNITDAAVRLADPRVIVSDLNARAVLTRTTAQITSMNGLVNGGPLTGTGRVEYTPENGLAARISATVSGAAMEFPQGLRSELDAALNLTLDVPPGDEAAPSGRLDGTVTVLRSNYREPMAIVTGLLAGLRTQQLAVSGESSRLLDALALDVRLVTDEDVIVDNNYGRFQLGGDLRVIGTAAAPALSGRAELREGGRLFIGRNIYSINFGSVDFSNPVAIEPVLNVEAATRAGGEDIVVTITGSAEAPTVDLRSPSNPDLGQAELTSLLLTGRRLEDLDPRDAAFVGTQVLGNFSGEVLGFASRAVGLDTLRLGGVDSTTTRRESTAVASDVDPTSRLTFGKSFGTDLDVTFSQSLRQSDAQTWIVDYLPRRGIDLRLISDDEDLRSYGFRHDIAVGGGPVTAAPAARRANVTRVSAVRVTGDLVLPEERVREQLHLKSGDRFDFVAWQEDHDRLERWYQQQGYLTVRVDAARAEGADGVALEFRVTAGPQTRVVIMGVDASPALRSRLENAWAQSVFDEFLIDEAQQIVRGELARDGYFQAKVVATVTQEAAVKTLTVAVDPGQRSSRVEVRVTASDEMVARRVEQDLIARKLIDIGVENPTGIGREATNYLRSLGYLRAQVKVSPPVFDESSAVVPIAVDEGSVFRLASVAFEGGRALPESDVRGAADLAVGSPYNPAAVDAARDRLVALFRREGFSTAAVALTQTVGETMPTVDAVFTVAEGPRQMVGEISVAGTRAINPEVILRALDLAPNAPLRAEDVFRARTRVFDTGLFRRVDVAPQAQPSSNVVPLRVTVEEWPALRVRYGFEVSEEHPENDLSGRDLVPGLSGDVSRRTLFGRAMTVGGAVELQRRERLARVFTSTPTLFGLPVESSLVGERSHEEFTAVTLVTDRTSVTWEQRAHFANHLTTSYAYTFERDHTVDTKPPDPFSPAFDITINIARVTAAAAWDSRDDPADTARGTLASYSLEFAPEAVGSDIRFIRHVNQAYYFRPWRRAIFASAARLGVVVPLGGQDLITSERFFAGGSRSVRGVPEGSLGPRDFFGPAGGQLMAVFNQEARVPLYKWLRGVGFVDAGNVFARPADFEWGKLVGSAGVGLRLATPFALLRVDYARTIHAGSLTGSQWTFGIGQAF